MNAAPRVKRKWRPRLFLVIFAVLGVVLSLPLAGLFFFRIYENELVRETEGELIAQSALLVAVFKREVEASGIADDALGAAVRAAANDGERYDPIAPNLDLASNALEPRRPEPQLAAAPARAEYQAIGARLMPLIVETQRVTLAGFRLLDPQGVVIGGREEAGLSLAHIPEVAEALRGRFSAVLRQRISKHATPPLYSASRGTDVRIFVAAPVILRDHVAGVVYLSRTPSNVWKQLYEERGKFASALLVVVALAAIIGLIFHRAISRPMRELIARTAAVAQGDRAAIRPLDHYGTAEFAQLSQSFLDMAASLNARSDFIATFAAHVSHELKSPLTSIQGAAELLREDIGALAMSDEMRRRFLDNIAADAQRLTALVNRMRDMARAEQSPIGGECRLDEVIDGLRTDFPELAVGFNGERGLALRISAENAHIIFANLADNAQRHGARRLDVEASHEGDQARVVFRDDGEGVSRSNRGKIFDSFFTTRRENGGTGMGLPIVRAMLRAHGGDIELLEQAKGAAFALALPCA